MKRLLLIMSAFAGTLGACDRPPAEEVASPVVAVAGMPLVVDRVVDRADLIPASAESRLAARLAELESLTTDQLVVVTLPSLGGETIEQVGLKLGNGWGIGQADKDNGVLLIVAPTERKVRIEAGRGLTTRLSDARAQQIIDQILPYFAEGAMDRGIEVGVEAIVGTLVRSNMSAHERKAA